VTDKYSWIGQGNPRQKTMTRKLGG
jgi:hypothetical protein